MELNLHDRDRRGWGVMDVALYLVGVAGLAAALTIVWLSMRAVLDIGGYCAEGGPYVVAQHCPDGVALAASPVDLWRTWLRSVDGVEGLRSLVARTRGLVLLAWPALFISLGWNFLQFALFPPDGMDGHTARLAHPWRHLRDHGRRAARRLFAGRQELGRNADAD